MKFNNLLIGATGSIGILELHNYITSLSPSFEHIKIILTASAEKMVQINCLSIFVDDVYSSTEYDFKKYSHIRLANWADAFLILPATANIIGKAANGIADDFLTTTMLSYGNNLIFCPNMNQSLWLNPIVQNNVKFLRDLHYNFIGPIAHQAYTTADRKTKSQYVIPDIDDFVDELRKILLS